MEMRRMQGWIKLHRQLLDNPIVTKDADHLAVWIYLLLKATHDEYPVVFGGNKIVLRPGELITGRKKIAEAVGVNESKVFRILRTFKNEQQIEQQTSNQNSLISILNWNLYQSSEHQDEQRVNIQCTTDEQQVNTNKKDKNIKNERKIFVPPSVEEVREYCVERKNGIDAEYFVSSYEAKGWMIGKSKMKDWKAAVRTWERNNKQKGNKQNGHSSEQRSEYEKFGL